MDQVGVISQVRSNIYISVWGAWCNFVVSQTILLDTRAWSLWFRLIHRQHNLSWFEGQNWLTLDIGTGFHFFKFISRTTLLHIGGWDLFSSNNLLVHFTEISRNSFLKIVPACKFVHYTSFWANPKALFRQLEPRFTVSRNFFGHQTQSMLKTRYHISSCFGHRTQSLLVGTSLWRNFFGHHP